MPSSSHSVPFQEILKKYHYDLLQKDVLGNRKKNTLTVHFRKSVVPFLSFLPSFPASLFSSFFFFSFCPSFFFHSFLPSFLPPSFLPSNLGNLKILPLSARCDGKIYVLPFSFWNAPQDLYWGMWEGKEDVWFPKISICLFSVRL